jgi:ABC-type ATPase involved in cell division
LEGFVRSTDGSARVCGYNVTKESEREELKKLIRCFASDFNALEKLSVKETSASSAKCTRNNLGVDDVIKLLNLEDKAQANFDSLSGGLKQRVGVAAALVSDPILFVTTVVTLVILPSRIKPNEELKPTDLLKTLSKANVNCLFLMLNCVLFRVMLIGVFCC